MSNSAAQATVQTPQTSPFDAAAGTAGQAGAAGGAQEAAVQAHPAGPPTEQRPTAAGAASILGHWAEDVATPGAQVQRKPDEASEGGADAGAIAGAGPAPAAGGAQPGAVTDGAAAAAGAEGAGAGGASAGTGGAPADPRAEEGKKLEERGRAALAALPKASAADEAKTPGNVGQGTIEASQELPDWFRQIQERLVASTTWGPAEEDAQHAIRDYALFVARGKSKDGKVPGHIKAFFDYIGRGSKNDTAARKAGYKGTAALTGAEGSKNWCAGAASSAQNIARTEGRAAVLADLKGRGLVPAGPEALFFENLAAHSGAKQAKMFYGDKAYAEPLEPGDRIDYLFKGCQYGGHAVHVVADLGGAFLHVSGNTTRHSAVATGQASRLKAKPAGLNLATATDVRSDESKKKATEHIASVSAAGGFDGGVLVYMIQRQSDPYKALELLDTDDEAAREAAMKKLLLKPVKGAS